MIPISHTSSPVPKAGLLFHRRQAEIRHLDNNFRAGVLLFLRMAGKNSRSHFRNHLPQPAYRRDAVVVFL